MSCGNVFHNKGADTSNDRRPYVSKTYLGLTSKCLDSDRSDLVGVYGLIKSEIYCGAMPLRALKVISKILNWIRYSTGNQ